MLLRSLCTGRCPSSSKTRSSLFNLHARLLRTSRPSEVGPLAAGIGVAMVLYGAKMVLDVANNPEVQETMRRAASPDTDRTSSSHGSTSDEDVPTSSKRSTESYFTTDVMGIDLGHGAKEWSGACAAVVSAGSLRVVESEQGGRTTPSAIAFSEAGDVLVGQPAKKLLFSRSARSVIGHQLLHGVQYNSTQADALRAPGALPYELTEDVSTGLVLVKVHEVQHKPEELSGRVLSLLRSSAERALGGGRSVLSAVLGAPVDADDAARAALVAAGKRAGLHRVELLDEAIAGAYAAEHELGGSLTHVHRLGVYALGGKAFSFSILERSAEQGSAAAGWNVLAARRSLLLGGECFDEAIVEFLISDFHAEHGIDLSHDHLALQRLHEAAEAAKVELSSAVSCSISLPFITADANGPKHMELSLSRAKFDSLVEPTLQATTVVSDEALAAASLKSSQLDAVLLLGGSARTAAVEALAARHFGQPTLRTTRPEEAIALGAAALAQRMQEQQFAN